MNQQTLLWIVIAVAAAAFAYGASVIIGPLLDPDRRKIKERLNSKGSPTETAASIVRAVRKTDNAPGLEGALGRLPILKTIRKMLAETWPDVGFLKFITLCGGMGTAVTAIVWLVMDNVGVAALAGLGAAYLPVMVLKSRRATRQNRLNNQLPEALDFLARVLRAGHSFSTGLQLMAEELPQPIGNEFQRCYDAHSLGQPIDDALRDTAHRVGLNDFSFFVTAVLVQRQTGGDLTEVLGNISTTIRSRIRLQSHVKAKTAEGRFTGYILVAFPVVMFVVTYIANPTNTGVLVHTRQGNMFLVTAFLLCVFGLWMIRKITTLKV
jgi:tight adherence protein B